MVKPENLKKIEHILLLSLIFAKMKAYETLKSRHDGRRSIQYSDREIKTRPSRLSSTLIPRDSKSIIHIQLNRNASQASKDGDALSRKIMNEMSNPVIDSTNLDLFTLQQREEATSPNPSSSQVVGVVNSGVNQSGAIPIGDVN